MVPEITNAVILFLAWRASVQFGGDDDGMFNSAGFSSVVRELLGIRTLDGLVVKLILSGRPGITKVGAAHWRVTM